MKEKLDYYIKSYEDWDSIKCERTEYEFNPKRKKLTEYKIAPIGIVVEWMSCTVELQDEYIQNVRWCFDTSGWSVEKYIMLCFDSAIFECEK